MRILVVDDYPLFVAVVIHYLRRYRHVEDVMHAYDALSGLRLVDEFKPDLVLVDYRMPSMDGVTFTRLLKSKPNPPKVVMMSFLVDGREQEALAAGADAYFDKDGISELLMPLLMYTMGYSSEERDWRARPAPRLASG